MELKSELQKRLLPDTGKKAELVQRLQAHLSNGEVKSECLKILSAPEAALEKAQAGENRAVEHIAELAPSQVVNARRAGPRRTSVHPKEEKKEETAARADNASADSTWVKVEVKVEENDNGQVRNDKLVVEFWLLKSRCFPRASILAWAFC